MKNSVFFAAEGQKGLNSTSAQHLCALASQLKDQAETSLQRISFVTTKLDLAGGASTEKIISLGINPSQFEEISSNIKICSDMNKIISWFSEARKALDAEKVAVSRYSIAQFCKDRGIQYPTSPEYPTGAKTVQMADAIDLLNVKEREEYLALEAKSAVLGKFIHKDNPMEQARTRMHHALVEPYTVQGTGRDTTIKHFEPSIDPEKVDQKFVELQAEYRATEQALNHMRSDLRKKVSLMQIEEEKKFREALNAYNEKSAEYSTRVGVINSEFNEWRVAEEERLSKVKFVIPDALQETITYLNNLAKK